MTGLANSRPAAVPDATRSHLIRWNVSKQSTNLLLGIIPLDCREVGRGDDAQLPMQDDSQGMQAGSRFWMRWIKGVAREARQAPANDPLAGGGLDLHRALCLLPERLSAVSLPDGVIELVIDDFEAPARQLFDVRNGQVRLIEPGSAVPWASISGPATAWTMALGAECDVAGLELTGDQHLARRVLAAFPRHA